MLIAPSVFPLYFSQGGTATANDAPSYPSNNAPVTPPKGTEAPRGEPKAGSSPSATPNSKPAAAPSSPTESKPAHSYNARTAALEGNAQPTASNSKSPNTSPAALPPRFANRSSPYRANTFNSVNQHMTHLEQRFTKRILRLEMERDEQQVTIQYLTEELERLIASLNSAPRSPIPIPVYDPIQAPPPPGASRPPLPPSRE